MQEPDIARWALIRDMLIFQIKLAMDAIRDLFLSPVSIICGLADIFIGNSHSKSYFYKLMDFGHQTDLWLNLFGKNKDKDVRDSSDVDSQKSKADRNIDQLFSQVESLLKDQHGKGGLTASAKTKIDSYLNKIVDKKASSE
jgi:hypothetical protein